jgi:hypothetical protein
MTTFKHPGVDVYVGVMSDAARAAATKRIVADDVAKANNARDAAAVALIEAQTAALAARIDRQYTELKLHDAEMRLRFAETQRRIEASATKRTAFEAREQYARDVAAGKVDPLAARARGEFEAFRARDQVDTTKADSPRDVVKRLVVLK